MEFNKEVSVVSSLYALRGGLSAIAVEYDKARNLDAAYYDKLNEIADAAGGARNEAPAGTVAYADYLINGEFRKELYKRLKSIKETQYPDTESVNYRRYIRGNKSSAVKKFVASAIFFALTALMLFGISQLVFHGFAGGVIGEGGAIEGVQDIFALIFILIFPLAALIIGIVMLVKGIICCHYVKVEKKALENYLDNLERTRRNEAQRVANARKAAQTNINRLPWVAENAQNVLDKRNQAIGAIVSNCNLFYRELLEQFSSLLDERDWKNLDLVIYQIETGRADSIKEALHQVDRELQTERIVKSVFNAAAMQATLQTLRLPAIGGKMTVYANSKNVTAALVTKAGLNGQQLLGEVLAIRQYS